MRRSVSTSLRLYIRWPVLLLTGLSWGNSVSQKRRTYAGRRQSDATSPMRKYNLSGITISSFRDALAFDLERVFIRQLHSTCETVSSTIGRGEQALERHAAIK